ncbi:MAG: HyaD/HybD family hydrogenase maturation endopeptidase [Gemmatimonadota bacterium]
MEQSSGDVLVLGIGNLLWADEGFGVRAVEAFNDFYVAPPGVWLLDGGTQGLNLLDAVLDRSGVIVFDAIDFGLAPGTLKVLRGTEVPAWAGTKMSLHQSSFQELLAIAELQGRSPARLTLIGVQPQRLSDFGGSLSDCVREQLPAAVELAAQELAAWGRRPDRRTAPGPRLNDHSLAIDAYETNRPDQHAACRVGDARFLNLRYARQLDGGTD